MVLFSKSKIKTFSDNEEHLVREDNDVTELNYIFNQSFNLIFWEKISLHKIETIT